MPHKMQEAQCSRGIPLRPRHTGFHHLISEKKQQIKTVNYSFLFELENCEMSIIRKLYSDKFGSKKSEHWITSNT